jgi:hypothetical protein
VIARTLVYLLRFYNLSGWRGWGSYASDLETSDSESENSVPSGTSPAAKPFSPHRSSPSSSFPPQPRTLEDAVEAHPELALQEIADELGLDYDRIESTAQAYKAYRAKQESTRTPSKRFSPPILNRELMMSKRQRPNPHPSPPPHVPHFTVEDVEASLGRLENPPPRSEPSIHTQLGYAVTSEEYRESTRNFYERDRLRREKAKEPQPPRGPPSGSPSATKPVSQSVSEARG